MTVRPTFCRPEHLVPCRVHDQPATFDGRRFGLAAHRRPFAARQLLAAQDRPDAGDQQPLGKRLGDIIVGAHREPEGLVEFVVLGGQEDDRDGAELAHSAKQLHPVHARHLDVEYAKVGRIVGKRLQRRRGVRINSRDKAFVLEPIDTEVRMLRSSSTSAITWLIAASSRLAKQAATVR